MHVNVFFLLTTATQPRAGMLSLIADRWLKKLLPRFRSRKLWISWMWSEMGFSRSWSSVCTRRRRRRKTERKRRSVESYLWHAEFSFFKFYKHFWSCDICPASAVSKLRTDTNFTGPLFSPLELGDLPSHLSVATNIPRFTGRSLWPCKAYHFPSVYSSPVMRQRSRTSRDTVFCRRFAAAAVDWLPRETSVAKGTG